ncbi:MAG TPA: YfhO family protein [Bacilli bacterium]|mgnify:CR=1 FL=1|nr:YfhO family protein [Bacilli bacterium]
MKDKIRNNKFVLFTFLISFAVVCIIYLMHRALPFGGNSLLAVDFYHQYGPMLSELYDKVRDGSNLIYSYNIGLGIPYYRNFLNYLSSPLNILLFLFKREHILIAFSLIIGLKSVLSATFMAYYLKKKFKKDNVFLIAIGLAYGLSAYFAAYYWNLMWLDGMVFLPLIVMGIENIIDKGKIKQYVCFLSIMLFSNYFIGYMICIFSVMYFFAYYFIKNKFRLYSFYKACLRFFIGSLLSFGLVAVLLIPMYYALRSISATHDIFPTIIEYNFSLLKFFANHFAGVKPTVFASDLLPLPNVSSSVIILPLVLLFFVNKKISIKEKIIYALLLLVFITSFEIKALDFIWHAFHVPNDLPYRYSFIYIFLLCTISYKSVINIKYIKYIYVIAIYLLLMAALITLKITYFENLSSTMFLLNTILLTIYTIIYITYKFEIISLKYVYMFIYGIIAIEMLVACGYNLNINQKASDYIDKYKNNELILSKLKQKDNSFYRVEQETYMTYNDGAYVGYNGISTFSSMAYENLSRLERSLGLAGNNINSYYYNMQTPVYNSMHALKYIIGNLDNNKYYSKYITSKNNIYKYKYNLPIMFPVDNNIKNWITYDINPFINQSSFIQSSTGVYDVFDRMYLDTISGCTTSSTNGEYINFEFAEDGIENEIVLTYKNNDNKNIYAYFYNSNIEYIIIGEDDYRYFSPNEPYIIELKNISKDINFTIHFKDKNENYLQAFVYAVNDDNFIKAYNILNKYEFKIKKFKNSTITGTIEVPKEMTMYTSIPYDNGWRVYINNKRVSTFKIGDALLGYKLNKGVNNIKLVYYPEKIILGFLITMVSISTIIVYEIILLKRRK